ncbi:MAG: prolyl oligopeptidase family serine peptidase [Saprospiraceae bacterium]|nr:prolyl oligopeptidase family serine peptidase [Saprospiraceae bacterium]
MFRIIVSSIALCLSSCIAVYSQDKWTVDDIIKTQFLGNPVISDDNNMIAWTKSKAVKKKDRFVRDIYVTHLDQTESGMPLTIQMTQGEESNSSPLFSADGNTLYFLSSREKGKKLWSLDLRGGEASSVHEFKHGISSIKWLNDSTICYLSHDGPLLSQQEEEKKKDNVVVVEDTVSWTRTRLYTFGVKDKKNTRMTEDSYPVRSYEVSPDGRWIIYTLQLSTHYASDANPDNQVILLDRNTGEKRVVLADLQEPGNFSFMHDSQGFYLVSTLSSDPEWNGAGAGQVGYYDLRTHEFHSIPLEWEWGATGSIYVDGTDVLVSLANGPLTKYAWYRKGANGWMKEDLDTGEFGEHLWILAMSKDGDRLVVEHSTGGALPKYFAVAPDANQLDQPLEFVTLNKGLTDKPIVRHEIMRWKGAYGDEVNGILYYPEDYEEGKRYPLMLSIHGGPSGVDQDRWRERWSTYPQIIAQRGAFVLKPNYHGSSNHGQKFVESIKGHYYDLEIEDILTGLEKLEQEGKVDPDQLGVMGWSNGAIIATMLTVRYPDMFKVACPGAGDVNWTSDFGTCRFGVSFDQSYFGGAPWDDLDGKTYNENYILKSPLFELEKVKTPTIIFHGSEDRAVPRDQGWEYYRALQQADQTPVRFLWFPGQPHGLGKITHQQRKMKEELAWIDRYLFDVHDHGDPSIKIGSPLAALSALDSMPHQQGLMGVLHEDVLIPAVQPWMDGIAIGSFEVTNAQYAAHDPNHRVPATQENYPALTNHRQALDYVAWLSDATGRTFRLPSEDEAVTLHEKAKKLAAKENTVRYWAGYDLNTRDATRLQQNMRGNPNRFIKAVGSFNVGKLASGTSLYDLGGNVAEFSATGSTYGFSAVDYADQARESQSSNGDLTGFRVVEVLK